MQINSPNEVEDSGIEDKSYDEANKSYDPLANIHHHQNGDRDSGHVVRKGSLRYAFSQAEGAGSGIIKN